MSHGYGEASVPLPPSAGRLRGHVLDAVHEGPVRQCGVCAGQVRTGDRAYVTLTLSPLMIHAVAHAPDCVGALEREARGT